MLVIYGYIAQEKKEEERDAAAVPTALEFDFAWCPIWWPLLSLSLFPFTGDVHTTVALLALHFDCDLAAAALFLLLHWFRSYFY